MSSRLRQLRSDAGDTLVEVLVTIVIMGLAVTAIVGGVATSILVSAVNREQATAGVIIRDYAEAIISANTPYVACAVASSYAATVTVPSGWSQPVVLNAGAHLIQYWQSNGSGGGSFVSTCPSPDQGAQSMWLQVSSPDGRDVETLQIVKRKP